jgi:hypothetical protein
MMLQKYQLTLGDVWHTHSCVQRRPRVGARTGVGAAGAAPQLNGDPRKSAVRQAGPNCSDFLLEVSAAASETGSAPSCHVGDIQVVDREPFAILPTMSDPRYRMFRRTIGRDHR